MSTWEQENIGRLITSGSFRERKHTKRRDIDMIVSHILSEIAQMKSDILLKGIDEVIYVDSFAEGNLGEDYKRAFVAFKNSATQPGGNERICSIVAAIKTLSARFPKEMLRSRRIRSICMDIGNVLSLSTREFNTLIGLSYLHNIGCLGINEEIWNSWNPLRRRDVEEIKLHPEIGYRVLQSIDGLSDLSRCILTHHERWDGTGYPDGLQHEDIPLPCRIFCVANSLDVLIEYGINKGQLSINEVLKTIRYGEETLFDPEVVQAFFDMIYLQPSQLDGSSLVDKMFAGLK
jgi:HD-GYP domain-containing protein (c-di-GMP phosphodiesterase class II)